MKAYTDIEQSKKLAKILPIESADMHYILMPDGAYNHFPLTGRKIELAEDTDIPCWSLASLLDVLPRVDIEKEICSDDTFDYRVKAYIGDGYIGEWFDNTVDACVEMIIKLNELNLL